MRYRNLASFAFILSSALLLTGCPSTPLNDGKVAIEEKSGIQPNRGPDPGNTGVVAPLDVTRGQEGLTGPQDGILGQRSVYFDTDSYIVKSEFKPLVEAHAKFLGTSKAKKIIIQGNTDERGGSEYNLALGQKRAEAVRKSLNLLGVPESQMEAVSFGKEKPKATGSDEASWAQNRRSDIVY